MFYSRAVLQRTIIDSPAFLEPSLAEKIAVCSDEEVGGLDRFLREAAQNFEVFLNTQD
jgi:hypothetical protein